MLWSGSFQGPGTLVGLLRRCAAIFWLVLLIVLLAGCAGALEVTDTTEQKGAEIPTSNTNVVAEPTVAAPEHNLGVVGIDFDPSLEYQEILKRGNLTLLVAVENSGQQAESKVEVHARLSVSSDSVADVFSAEGKRLIEQIAPGEIVIVPFEGIDKIPIRSHYTLEVSVVPVADETTLSDNERSFDIFVNGIR